MEIVVGILFLGVAALAVFAPEILAFIVIGIIATLALTAISMGIYELGKMIYNFFNPSPEAPPPANDEPAEPLNADLANAENLDGTHQAVQQGLNLGAGINNEDEVVVKQAHEEPVEPVHNDNPVTASPAPQPAPEVPPAKPVVNIAHDLDWPKPNNDDPFKF